MIDAHVHFWDGPLDWMSGDSLLTVTVSDVPPTVIASSPTPTRSPPLTATPGDLRVLKPGIETSMV